MKGLRLRAGRVSAASSLAGLAVLVAAAALHAGGDDKKLPKKPDRPFTLAVTASPRPAPSNEVEAKEAKEVTDSLADVRKNVQDKRRDWFTLVEDPAQADIILEIKGRGWEKDHGAVVQGRVFVLDMDPTPIIGQGAVNSNSISFSFWREAAGNMTGRLQSFCQKTYDSISAARRRGIRPLGVIENDRGVELFKSGHHDEAKQAFGEAIRLSPASALPHFNRGLLHSTLKDYEHAMADFDATLRIDPSYPKASFYRGMVHRERGELEPARADFTEAIRIDAKNGEAYLSRGGVLKSLGDTKAAVADFDQAVSLGGRKGEALAQRGSAYQALGESEKALADYDAALAAGPESGALHYNRGLLLAAKGDPRACGAFSAAVALDKTDLDSLFERGLCSAKHGELERAIADFSECARLRPNMALAYFNRGICYGKQKRVKLASADRARALKLDQGLATKK